VQWPVAEFALAGSTLGAGGSEYRTLARFALG
jgi:2'-5' RNA ligase